MVKMINKKSSDLLSQKQRKIGRRKLLKQDLFLLLYGN